MTKEQVKSMLGQFIDNNFDEAADWTYSTEFKTRWLSEINQVRLPPSEDKLMVTGFEIKFEVVFKEPEPVKDF